MTQIPHAEQLGKARTAADLVAIIALLDTALNDAIACKQELQQAEDRAVFGEGDLAAVRAALDDCNVEIALIEKTIEAADKRRVGAPQNKAGADTRAPGDEVRIKAEALGERWQMVHWLIEQLRRQLFEADALKRDIASANSRFDAAGKADLKVNMTIIRRAATTGPRAAAPAGLGASALQADKQLLSLFSPGGALDPRPAVGAPVGGATRRFSVRGRSRG
ncbi:hypothetical protein NMG46_27570 [Mesorhizobium sp. LMG 17147]|uniref:hypothetical protein n=1 Tax=Mesorhizobium sp. LMG 17147 TaxID=2963091 RepID=UPI0020C9813F|nr:hypothetical protein [Mesorhizobium sp. LMG 17147]